MNSTEGAGTSRLANTLFDIAAFGVEHEGSLDVLRLVDYIDLYQQHVEQRGDVPDVAFHDFVRDEPLLREAATARAAENGTPVAVRAFEPRP